MEKRQNRENLNSVLKMRALSTTFRWMHNLPALHKMLQKLISILHKMQFKLTVNF